MTMNEFLEKLDKEISETKKELATSEVAKHSQPMRSYLQGGLAALENFRDVLKRVDGVLQ